MTTSRTTRLSLAALLCAGLFLTAGLMAQEAAKPEAPAPTVSAKPLSALELADAKTAFLEAHNEYLQKQLEVTSMRGQIGEEKITKLQESMTALQPLMAAVQAAYAPLQATCKEGENFDPDPKVMKCKAGPQAQAAAPAKSEPKKQAVGKK